MVPESKTLLFFPMVLGNTINIHVEILSRLRQRLQLREAYAENHGDVIIAFVPVVSRAGTDIEAALQRIPRSQPVVLMVLHFTFDENYMAPNSTWNLDRDDVFAVDLLCYEDIGLLRSQRNDEALKAVTDHLISKGASPNTQLQTTGSQTQCSPLVFIFCFIFVILIAIAIGVGFYLKTWANRTEHNNTIDSRPVRNTFD